MIDPEPTVDPRQAPRRTLVFDIDGVLCTNTWGDYERAQPLREAIARVNALSEAGHRILLHTARGTVSGKDLRGLTESQLREWGVAYDELWMGKPDADLYIDDRAINSRAWLSDSAAGETVRLNAPPVVLAEVGCNHMGDVAMALEMIDVAAGFCGVDVVKFQKRTPRELLSPDEFAAPHPEPRNAFGPSYGEHRERLELPIADHARLKERCESRGVGYLTSVWDLTAAREAMTLEPSALKIPSARNNDWALLGLLAREFPGQLHISLGMTTMAEEQTMIDLLGGEGRLDDTVLYACTAGYPIADSEACLLEIERLRQTHGDRVAAIGYSGHHNGIALDMGAIALGATWLERHFTLDRTLRGTDHAASLEPDGLRRLKRDSLAMARALSHKPRGEMLDVELGQRAKLKRPGAGGRADAPVPSSPRADGEG
jgi:sialic acid synthase